MKIFKRITATAMAAALLSTPAYADYEFGNLKQFHSFEDYSSEYNEKQNPEPEDFVYTSSTFRGLKGYAIDENRQSKTFKLNGYATESTLKFGTIVDSGMIHLSYDIYQDYVDDKPASKAKTMLIMLARTASGTYSNGWYHGSQSSAANYYDQYDPEAINFDSGSGAYQTILDHGKIDEWGDDSNPVPGSKGPLSYYNLAKSWGTLEAYDPDMIIEWRNWYKLDIFFDKDNHKYEVYVNGELVEGQKYSAESKTFVDFLASTLDSSNTYKATKGVVFRAQTAVQMFTGVRPATWHTRNGGYFLLDNVYVKSYTGDNDIISLISDDKSGDGVALSGGTLNVAYSEYMDRAATKDDVRIKNVLTGEEVTDFEISNSDNMQFVINFGDDTLAHGQYKVNVSGVKGKISGGDVAVPAYFNTIPENNAWVSNVECLRSDGVAQERGIEATSGTTSVSVKFSEPVNVTDEEAINYFNLETDGETAVIDRCEVSEDKMSVKLHPQYLFEPGSEYTLTVLGGLPTVSGNVMLTNSRGNAIEETISIANDPRCEYGQELVYDSESGTATFSVDIVKSDASKIRYTMVAASYKDVEDENGNTVPQMIDVQYVPIAINEDQRILKKYITDVIDCTGADRVKAFIWDYPSFNNVYKYEEEL